ncbi:spermatoproteinsis associated 1 [Chamberlinius hualienensis]
MIFCMAAFVLVDLVHLFEVLPELTLQDVRKEIAYQLGCDVLPSEFVFLRSIGKNFAKVRTKQERHLKVKFYLPPFVVEPEIFLLKNLESLLASSSQSEIEIKDQIDKLNCSRRKPKRFYQQRRASSAKSIGRSSFIVQDATSPLNNSIAVSRFPLLNTQEISLPPPPFQLTDVNFISHVHMTPLKVRTDVSALADGRLLKGFARRDEEKAVIMASDAEEKKSDDVGEVDTDITVSSWDSGVTDSPKNIRYIGAEQPHGDWQLRSLEADHVKPNRTETQPSKLPRYINSNRKSVSTDDQASLKNRSNVKMETSKIENNLNEKVHLISNQSDALRIANGDGETMSDFRNQNKTKDLPSVPGEIENRVQISSSNGVDDSTPPKSVSFEIPIDDVICRDNPSLKVKNRRDIIFNGDGVFNANRKCKSELKNQSDCDRKAIGDDNEKALMMKDNERISKLPTKITVNNTDDKQPEMKGEDNEIVEAPENREHQQPELDKVSSSEHHLETIKDNAMTEQTINDQTKPISTENNDLNNTHNSNEENERQNKNLYFKVDKKDSNLNNINVEKDHTSLNVAVEDSLELPILNTDIGTALKNNTDIGTTLKNDKDIDTTLKNNTDIGTTLKNDATDQKSDIGTENVISKSTETTLDTESCSEINPENSLDRLNNGSSGELTKEEINCDIRPPEKDTKPTSEIKRNLNRFRNNSTSVRQSRPTKLEESSRSQSKVVSKLPRYSRQTQSESRVSQRPYNNRQISSKKEIKDRTSKFNGSPSRRLHKNEEITQTNPLSAATRHINYQNEAVSNANKELRSRPLAATPRRMRKSLDSSSAFIEKSFTQKEAHLKNSRNDINTPHVTNNKIANEKIDLDQKLDNLAETNSNLKTPKKAPLIKSQSVSYIKRDTDLIKRNFKAVASDESLSIYSDEILLLDLDQPNSSSTVKSFEEKSNDSLNKDSSASKCSASSSKSKHMKSTLANLNPRIIRRRSLVVSIEDLPDWLWAPNSGYTQNGQFDEIANRRELLAILRVLRARRRKAKRIYQDYMCYVGYLRDDQEGYGKIGLAVDMWKRKYGEELRETHVIRNQCQRFQQHLKVLRHQNSNKLPPTTPSDPSNLASLKTTAMKLISEIETLSSKVEDAKIQVVAESKLKTQVVKEAKMLRAEAVDRKIDAAIMRTQTHSHFK